MKRVALLTVAALVAGASASASASRVLRGSGVTLTLPQGWHGLVGPGGVQAADFPLPRRARSSASLVRVPRGHVHLIVWNYGPWVVYLPSSRPARTPPTLRMRELLRGGLEGFGSNDTFALRTTRLGGDMLEIVADLGPKPLPPDALRKANMVLKTLRVLPARVLRPRYARLTADGVSVRLLDGWSGRIEIPAQHYAARIVLRAARGNVHLELVEDTQAPTGDHLALPVVLTSRDVSHHNSLTFAHRVFSTGGRSFELNVTMDSAGALQAANRLLATLRVAPRPWTFRSCDLTLRLPGTWHVAIKPRGGCYPVLKLYGPHGLVVLTELRPGEHATGRILQRAGRRFRVVVTPASARAGANAVLATLRAKPRS